MNKLKRQLLNMKEGLLKTFTSKGEKTQKRNALILSSALILVLLFGVGSASYQSLSHTVSPEAGAEEVLEPSGGMSADGKTKSKSLDTSSALEGERDDNAATVSDDGGSASSAVDDTAGYGTTTADPISGPATPGSSGGATSQPKPIYGWVVQPTEAWTECIPQAPYQEQTGTLERTVCNTCFMDFTIEHSKSTGHPGHHTEWTPVYEWRYPPDKEVFHPGTPGTWGIIGYE